MYLLTPTIAIEAKPMTDETSIVHLLSENQNLSTSYATVFMKHVRNE